MLAARPHVTYPFPHSLECTMTLICRLDEGDFQASVHDAVAWLEERIPQWWLSPGFKGVEGLDINTYPYRNSGRIYVPFGMCRGWVRRLEAEA